MMKNFLIVSVLLAACLLQDADAIQCYKCTSANRPDCAKPVKVSDLQKVNCDIEIKPSLAEEFQPVTKCATLHSKDSAGAFTTRGCHFVTKNNPKPDECRLEMGQTKESCMLCSSDLCNSAGRLATYGIVAMLAAVAITFAF